MKKSYLLLFIITALVFAGTSASAADDLIQTVVNGCKQELETYCKDVTPGEGRVLACL